LIPIDASSSGAEQVMLAAGVALTLKSARKNTSAVILFVEGNQTAGKEWEAALRFVTAQHLGLIIVCLGATGYKQKKVLEEPGARIAVKGLPPALQVDASDCVAIYRVTQEALTHAREGSRPTVIRALETVALVRAKGAVDPIALMEDYLRSKKLFSRKLQITVFSEFKKKLKLARAR
jgi:TPP-dependent pyruvate/acetoin dehydrogenase alpha subunit